MRILIVENDILVALSIEETLISAGHDVVACVSDAEGAVKVGSASHLDVALVDFHLDHGCSGVEVARLLTPRGIGILFVSSNPDGCRAAIESGALGCLRKPFTGESLIATVAVVEAILKGKAPAKLPQGLELYPS
jgi:DNA-binding response OmpR family regulator